MGGGSCERCGAWVELGRYHVCPGPLTAEDRIAAALERIAHMLERADERAEGHSSP